jgi:sialic acid synthase SpsE
MLFIAEIGLNHNGNFDLCFEMIKQAKYAGADVAKFQLGWRDGPDEINQLDLPRLEKLKEWCEYFEIEFMSSIITPEAFKLIRKVNPNRYKVASRTLKDNPDLAGAIVAEGKETIVSLGMWEGDTLPFDSPNVRYLWCKSCYPAEPKDLVGLPKNFTDSPYWGYSDHSIGIETALLAIARGAQCIEKHFTLDKSSVVIRDHALSSTPDEFAMMVNIGRDIAKKLALGV